ncbi:MAG TPA: TonB-dependent receptor [Gallionella sp.]|nr:TonB-dependent receptor [Gallionella sp.]
MKRLMERLLAILLVLVCAVNVYAATETQKMDLAQAEEEELSLAYGDKDFVSIATGFRQPIARAPSVATVITAEDISAIGAADLDEVLETVPGLHVSRSPSGYNPIYIIRGIATPYNPQVLMLVNGIPITGVTFGDRSQIWAGFPLESIARIEVIRGPGSALYGADAFAGVINIITKTAPDINGTELGLRAGSFNSLDGWVQHGGQWGAFDVAAYLRAGRTDGQRQIISVDAQSTLDALTGTTASLAPGPVNLGYDAIDGRIDLSREKWRLRAGIQQRSNAETGAGVASALDPVGSNYGRRVNADLTYQDNNFAQDLDVTAQASYFYITEQSDLTLYPPGSNPFYPSNLVPFPDGVIGNPYKWERHSRFNLSAIYTRFQTHKLRFGAGTQEDNLYQTQETNNFSTGAPGQVIEVSPFLLPHSRRVNYVYAQDEWAFIKDWYLTAGVRQDHYSDFGSTTNPRLALVWETAYNLTSKLLYGRAFRPPSFSELYNVNNPVLIGNPNLKPETNQSTELAFVWQATSTLQANLNLFHYLWEDILRPDSNNIVQNSGTQHGDGFEVEMNWDARPDLRLTGNYAQQHSIDDTTGQDAGYAPRHHLYARADWVFRPRWNLDGQFNYVADRKRPPGDIRPDIADYHTVDVTLRNKNQSGDWSFAFKVLNLFDAYALEPSPYATPFAPFSNSVPIPYDLPLAGRAWQIELTHQL